MNVNVQGYGCMSFQPGTTIGTGYFLHADNTTTVIKRFQPDNEQVYAYLTACIITCDATEPICAGLTGKVVSHDKDGIILSLTRVEDATQGKNLLFPHN